MPKRIDLRKPQRRLPPSGNPSESRLSSFFSIVDWGLAIGNHIYSWSILLILAFLGAVITVAVFRTLTRRNNPLWLLWSFIYESVPLVVWILTPLMGIGIVAACWLAELYERRNQQPRSRGRQLLSPEEAQRRTLGNSDPRSSPRRFRDRK